MQPININLQLHRYVFRQVVLIAADWVKLTATCWLYRLLVICKCLLICLRVIAVNLSWSAIVWRQVASRQVTCVIILQSNIVAQVLRATSWFLQLLVTSTKVPPKNLHFVVQNELVPVELQLWSREDVLSYILNQPNQHVLESFAVVKLK